MTARCWLGSIAAGLLWAVLLAAGTLLWAIRTDGGVDV